MQANDTGRENAVNGNLVDKRITQCRLAVWLTVGLLTFLIFRAAYPLAWQVAAFGGVVTLLWPFVRHQKGSEQKTEEHASASSIINPQSSLPSSFSCDPLCHSIEIGLDMMVSTALIAVSGGFGSPFAPLVFVAVLEAYALLGRRAAIYAALAAALLNLVHFRAGISPQSAILYGLATGTLFVSALLAGISQVWQGQGQAGPQEDGAAWGRRGTPLLKPIDIEELQLQLEANERAHEQMRDNYRDVTRLHREQSAQIARMRVSEQLFEASVGAGAEAGDGAAAFTRVLRLVMELSGAGGGVLWLRTQAGSLLAVQACEGRVAASLRSEKILHADTLTPSELRARCETLLQSAAPVPFRSTFSRLDAQQAVVSAPNQSRFENAAAVSAAETLFESASESVLEDRPETAASLAEVLEAALPPDFSADAPARGMASVGVVIARSELLGGGILGAIGVCDPRSQSRFLAADLDRLQSLSRPLAAAISNILQRVEAGRSLRETTLLYELSRLSQTTPDRGALYEAIVALAMRVAPGENATLFLLDRTQQRLEPRATQGRVVNLLDHIGFERGHGVSGWVAASGRPLHIADLAQEPNLLDVEMIPPRVRSFVAMPLRVRGRIIGVLNVSHSSPRVFGAEDTRLLALLTEQAALTLEHASALLPA